MNIQVRVVDVKVNCMAMDFSLKTLYNVSISAVYVK